MTLLDPHGGERKGEGFDGGPDGGVGEGITGACVDEGGVIEVGPGGDEGGDVYGGVGWEWDWLPFADEGGCGGAVPTSGVHHGGGAIVRHGCLG